MTIRRISAPSGAKTSSVYTARVKGNSEGSWTSVHVYEVPKSGHFISFQTDEPVSVEVTYTGVTITAAAAIGRSFDTTNGTDTVLSGSQTGSVYTVALDSSKKNGYYTIDFNNNHLQEELTSKAPFIIFANPLETVPTASGTVKVLGPGWHYVNGSGAIASGNSTPSNVYYSVPQGHTLYLEDGAILRGKVRFGSDTEGGGGVTSGFLKGLGQVDASYIPSPNQGRPLRINQSSGVVVDGPIFISGYHWGVVARKCTGATITNVKSFAHRTGSPLAGTPDAFDMVGSSNITISKFFSRGYDDGVTIKTAMASSMDWDAASSNVHYTNGVIYQGWAGNACEVGYEIPHNISNCSFKNITIPRKLARADTVNRDALSILSEGPNGDVSGITFENIVVHYCEERYIGIQALDSGANISGTVVKNVEFKQNAKALPIVVTGVSGGTVTNTSFEQLKFADDSDVSSAADVDLTTNAYATGTTFTGGSGGGGTPVTLLAAHDVWVQGNGTKGSWQGDTTGVLKVKNSTDTNLDRKSFLRFNTQPSNVGFSSCTEAKLRVYVSATDGTCDVSVYPVTDDTWTEGTSSTTGMTWGTAPTNGSPIDTVQVTGTGWIEFDVTSYINSEMAANSYTSFLLYSSLVQDKLVTFVDDEATTNEPELVLTP